MRRPEPKSDSINVGRAIFSLWELHFQKTFDPFFGLVFLPANSEINTNKCYSGLLIEPLISDLARSL